MAETTTNFVSLAIICKIGSFFAAPEFRRLPSHENHSRGHRDTRHEFFFDEIKLCVNLIRFTALH